jgi:hypothetical protein
MKIDKRALDNEITQEPESYNAYVVCPRCGCDVVAEMINGKPTSYVAGIGDNARCCDCKIEFFVKEEHVLTPAERKEKFPLIVRQEETGERICGRCGDDDPDSYHYAASLSKRMFLCSACWQEQEDAEAEREQWELEWKEDEKS